MRKSNVEPRRGARHNRFVSWCVVGWSVLFLAGANVSLGLPYVNSVDLIEDALSNGAISQSQALSYKAALWFDPSDLPKEYWVKTDSGPQPVGPHCGTPLFLELQRNKQSLPTQYAARFGSLRAQGQAPTYATELTYQSGQFMFHWSEDPEDGVNQLVQYDLSPVDGVADDTDGDNVPDYVEDLAEWFQFAWETEVWHPLFFFRDPPRDGEEGGGNNLLDVYIMQLSIGTLGVTYTDTGQPYFGMPTTPCDFDNVPNDGYDPVYGYTKGNMKAASAHELFHGIQMGYGFENEAEYGLFIIEGTAVWMQDAVYDNLNATWGWLDYIFDEPDIPLLLGAYATYPYWIFMSERYGTDGFGVPAYQGEDRESDERIDPRGVDFIRAVWEESEDPDNGSFMTVNSALAREDQGDFDTAFSEFTIAVACKELGNTTWNDFNEDDEREERFTDVNWNGTWDEGESFIDADGSGDWDSGFPRVAYAHEVGLSGGESLDLGVDTVSEFGADYFYFELSNTVGDLTLHLDGEDGITGEDWPVFTATLLLISERTLEAVYSVGFSQPENLVTIVKDVRPYDEAILVMRSSWIGGTYSVMVETTETPPTGVTDGWMRASNALALPMVGLELFGMSNGSMAGVMGIANPGNAGYLPHYRVSSDWWTGVAFANPTMTENTINLTAYGNAGAAMGSTVLTVPPMGRISRLVRDLFTPTRSTNDPSQGWIHYSASAPLAAMEIYGNAVTGGISALPGASAGTELYLPHFQSNSSWWTGVAIVNVDVTDPNPNLIALEAYDNSGSLVVPIKSHALEPGEKITAMVDDPSFLGVTQALAPNGGWIKVSAQRPVVAMEAYGLRAKTGNASMSASPVGNVLYLPRLIHSSDQRTGIALINTTNTAATVTLTPYNEAGVPLGGENLALPARQKLSNWADVLFPGLPSPVAGFVRVLSTQPLAGMQIIFNRNISGFAAETAVAAPGSPLVFPQFSSNETWWTLYSFSMVGTSGSQTTIDLYDALGNRLLQNSFDLGGNATNTGFVGDLLN